MSSEQVYPGKLHKYNDRQVAFEFETKEASENAVIFIGGLTDGLLTVPYVPRLHEEALPAGWGVFQILFSSSYIGWGTGSLDRDIKEIGDLVKYLKDKLNKKKVILFGHSTGTQDSIHYLLKDGSGVDGIVLQAPVSDREAIAKGFSENGLNVDEYNKEAKEYYDKAGPDALLPKKFSDSFLGAPLSAYRWLSLADVDGDDDYFSSDLSDSKLKATFGKISKPILVLYSGEDQFFPVGTDTTALVKRWESFTDPKFWSKYSTVIEGATHNVGPDSKEGAVESLIKQVQGFFSEL